MGIIAETMHGIEVHAVIEDLVADYIPDGSGRYRIFLVEDPEASFDYLVTEIRSVPLVLDEVPEIFAEIIERSEGYDEWPERDDWMLTEDFGSAPDLDEKTGSNVVWIHGKAYLASWSDDVIALSTPPMHFERIITHEEE